MSSKTRRAPNGGVTVTVDGRLVKKWTREVAVEWLKAKGADRKARGLDPAPRLCDMMPHRMTFFRLFGGIAKAQAAAGFEPRKPGRPKKEATDE